MLNYQVPEMTLFFPKTLSKATKKAGWEENIKGYLESNWFPPPPMYHGNSGQLGYLQRKPAFRT